MSEAGIEVQLAETREIPTPICTRWHDPTSRLVVRRGRNIAAMLVPQSLMREYRIRASPQAFGVRFEKFAQHW